MRTPKAGLSQESSCGSLVKEQVWDRTLKFKLSIGNTCIQTCMHAYVHTYVCSIMQDKNHAFKCNEIKKTQWNEMQHNATPCIAHCKVAQYNAWCYMRLLEDTILHETTYTKLHRSPSICSHTYMHYITEHTTRHTYIHTECRMHTLKPAVGILGLCLRVSPCSGFVSHQTRLRGQLRSPRTNQQVHGRSGMPCLKQDSENKHQ